MERHRRTDLYRAIRTRMRSSMGMAHESDRLPAPRLRANSGSEDMKWIVPDWSAPESEAVLVWTEDIAREVLHDLSLGEGDPYPKVGEEDRNYEVLLDAAKVTLLNYVKRYKSENDDSHAERKARYARKRRRWARKDLKQHRRAQVRAGLVESDNAVYLDQMVMHFDYMSSEHSSPGSDSSDEDGSWHADKVRQRADLWTSHRSGTILAGSAGDGRVTGLADVQCQNGSGGEAKSKTYGWAPGLAARVLEVRTPSWRSAKLNEMYAQLDAISSSLADSRSTPKSSGPSQQGSSQSVPHVKLGHVAPSHCRFRLPPELRRKGSLPRFVGKPISRKRRRGKIQEKEDDISDVTDAGEKGWMWASGTVGVWPTRV